MRVAAASLYVAAIFRWQEIRDQALNNTQAMFRQLQIADHLRIEQRYRVRGDGIAKPRMKLLRDRGTANNATPFQNRYLESARSQICGAHKAVMPTTDDQRIGLRG